MKRILVVTAGLIGAGFLVLLVMPFNPVTTDFPITLAQTDTDGDTIPDDGDNCRQDYNPADADDDGSDGEDPIDGDDNDDDTLVDEDYMTGQEDFDDDGAGDACDPDDDNGGTPDGQESRDDTNPLNPTDDLPLDTDDTDGDGALNWEEDWCGTDPFDDCGDDCGGAATDDAWAYDIQIDCWANATDMLLFVVNISGPAMPTQLGVHPSYQRRYDLNGDSWVNAMDQLMFPARLVLPLPCTNP